MQQGAMQGEPGELLRTPSPPIDWGRESVEPPRADSANLLKEYERMWRTNSTAERRLTPEQTRNQEDLLHQMDRMLDKFALTSRMRAASPRATSASASASATLSASMDGLSASHELPLQHIEDDESLPQTIATLQSGLVEVHRWNTLFEEITHNSELCPSKSLAMVLDRIRTTFTDYFSSLDLLFSQVKDRAETDWSLSSLNAKKHQFSDNKRHKLKELEDALAEEMQVSQRFQSKLEQTKESLLTSRANSCRMAETKATLVFDRETETLALNTNAAGSYDSQGNNDEHDTTVKIKPIQSGQLAHGTVSSHSLYYCFTLEKDDSGLQLDLSQRSPGTDKDFCQVALNHGIPPTATSYTYLITTRNSLTCALELKAADMALGLWFIRVSGRGFAVKEFEMELRIPIRALTETALQIKDIVDDIEIQSGWRGVVAEKMVIMDDMMTALLPKTQEDFRKSRNNRNRSSQYSVPVQPPVPMNSLRREAPADWKNAKIYKCFPEAMGKAKDAKAPAKYKVMAQLARILHDYSLFSLKCKTPQEFCSFVVNYFVTQAQGDTKKGITELHQFLLVADKKFAKLARTKLFLRFVGLTSPVFYESDTALFVEVYTALRKYDTELVDDHDGNMTAHYNVFQSVVEDMFHSHPAIWKAGVYSRIEKQLIAHMKENKISRGSRRGSTGGKTSDHVSPHMSVDVDVFVLAVCENNVTDKFPIYEKLVQLFICGDCAQSGSLNYEKFIACIQMTAFWFTALEICLMFREALALSELKKKQVDVTGLVLVGFKYAILERPADIDAKLVLQGIAEQAVKEDKEDGQLHVDQRETYPSFCTYQNRVPFPDTSNDISTRYPGDLVSRAKEAISLPVICYQHGDDVARISQRRQPRQPKPGDEESDEEDEELEEVGASHKMSSEDVQLLHQLLRPLHITDVPEFRNLEERAKASVKTLLATWEALKAMLLAEISALVQRKVQRAGMLNRSFEELQAKMENMSEDPDAREDLFMVRDAWARLIDIIERLNTTLMARPLMAKPSDCDEDGDNDQSEAEIDAKFKV